jgi:hypothetical protein
MKPIYKAWLGHIEIISYCGRECVYCSRCDRHLDESRKWFISADDFSDRLKAYKDWPTRIGLMGGEPLLHPKLDELCRVVREQRKRPILFTSLDPSKSKWNDELIRSKIRVEYHAHNIKQEASFWHQPLTIAIKDAIPNPELRAAMIDDCWLQRYWCPTISRNGAYFCEVAGAIAQLMGVKGWPLYKEDGTPWWNRVPEEFGYQLDLCQYCGMAIPMHRQKMLDRTQKISPSFLALLNENNLPTGKYELFEDEITVSDIKEALPGWKPGIYRKEQLRESDAYKYSTIEWDKW